MTERREIQDPSANVIQLVGNAKQYLEDLHRQSAAFYDQKLALIVESSRRERQAESERINFLRGVDVEAVRVAQLAQEKRAELLAVQMVENAETLRLSVAETAKTLATQLQQLILPLDSRVKIVEEKQYTLAGSSKGRGDMWGYISGGVMFVILVVKFYLDSLPK